MPDLDKDINSRWLAKLIAFANLAAILLMAAYSFTMAKPTHRGLVYLILVAEIVLINLLFTRWSRRTDKALFKKHIIIICLCIPASFSAWLLFTFFFHR